jgi:transcription elongation factor SPT4
MSDYDDEDDGEGGMMEDDDRAILQRQLAQAPVPNDLKTIRACKRCGLLKTQQQFFEYGCENCSFLRMEDNIERVNNYTTAFFEGQTAVFDPRESWAAKWIRVDSFVPGVYAITVTGQLDRETEEDLENQGIRWRCRPAS